MQNYKRAYRVWRTGKESGREREREREREMLFNYTKQDRMQISKGIFFKATNKTKTNR